MIKSYRDLDVWQKAMDLVIECYRMTTKFPKSEIYGLSSQLQRASVSLPANIAERHQRQHGKEFLQYLSRRCPVPDLQLLVPVNGYVETN